MNELLDSSSALSIEHLQGFETLSHNSSAIAIATSKVSRLLHPAMSVTY